jgi:hypothetical protein
MPYKKRMEYGEQILININNSDPLNHTQLTHNAKHPSSICLGAVIDYSCPPLVLVLFGLLTRRFKHLEINERMNDWTNRFSSSTCYRPYLLRWGRVSRVQPEESQPSPPYGSSLSCTRVCCK